MSANQQALLTVAMAVGTTYATWNPSDKGSNVVLSNGNLTMQQPQLSWQSVRSTIGKSSGKWYWEVKFDSAATSIGMIGVANTSAAVSTFIGSDANGWSFITDGRKINNGSAPSYGSALAQNDIIGIALDMDGGTIEVFKNNSSMGVMYTGLSGTLYASASSIQPAATPVSQFTANFGATTMTYTAPSGYNQGLYT